MEDEVAALSAIYAAPGESVERVAPGIVRVQFPHFSITFDLPEDYPDSKGAPKVGVSSADGSVAGSELLDLSRKMEREAERLSGAECGQIELRLLA